MPSRPDTSSDMPTLNLPALTLVTGLQRLYTCNGTSASDQAALLIGGRRILGLLTAAEAAAAAAALGPTVLDAAGLIAAPGLVDLHVHVCGGGGESGPASRTPEAQLSELLNAGMTTVVGVLGTDSVSRSQEALVAKVRALRADGISAFHWCGSYRLPPATVTGSVQRELCCVDSCVGVGEVAVSDHRGSAPAPLDLARLALEARAGGMLGGKPGLVHCHVGGGRARLQPLRDALAAAGGDLPIGAFHPTHVARSAELAEEGAAWLADGGSLDLTCDSAECRRALRRYRQRGLPLERVTVSTDAYGSLPRFDERGRLVEYGAASPDALLAFIRAMVGEEGWALEEVLPLAAANPARLLRLEGKGRLAVGADADVLLLEPSSLELRYVIAGGEVVKTPEWVRGGMFERGAGVRPRPLAALRF